MQYLVGYTGFVGTNLMESHKFEGCFNSKNIEEAFGGEPDLLVYSGVRAEMYLANKNPEEDFKIIQNAIENIKKINPKKVVLISTIGVYKNPDGVDEDTAIDTDGLLPYGKNRYLLEKWVEENYKDYLIVRLPGLYGKNLKKNYIYDFIHFIPSMLTEQKFIELSARENTLYDYYYKLDNGFYKCRELEKKEAKELRDKFNALGFSALNFTDSRGQFQYYNLANLWDDIQVAMEAGIKKLNLAVEPVSIHELYHYLTNGEFENVLSKEIPKYNYYTRYASLFGGQGHYLYGKEKVLEDIKSYVDMQLKESEE